MPGLSRDDVAHVARPSLPVEQVLANAADREGDFIRVPPILGGD
jgi:Asp-tRNA(Asn)/Glu-tRNA(Gln) amidotransferase C subunit